METIEQLKEKRVAVKIKIKKEQKVLREISTKIANIEWRKRQAITKGEQE